MDAYILVHQAGLAHATIAQYDDLSPISCALPQATQYAPTFNRIFFLDDILAEEDQARDSCGRASRRDCGLLQRLGRIRFVFTVQAFPGLLYCSKKCCIERMSSPRCAVRWKSSSRVAWSAGLPVIDEVTLYARGQSFELLISGKKR